jgi:hypothetical protein
MKVFVNTKERTLTQTDVKKLARLELLAFFFESINKRNQGQDGKSYLTSKSEGNFA